MSPLNWYRSWPERVPVDRAYVQDGLPRLVMSDCDYRSMPFPGDESGFCMLEWDMALDLRGRTLFAELAIEDPQRVLVAPYYKFYGGAPRQVHRLTGLAPLPEGMTSTDLFGFGCIYFPPGVVDDFLTVKRHPREKFTDTTFSYWYRRIHGRARVTWDVHPQHLHGD